MPPAPYDSGPGYGSNQGQLANWGRRALSALVDYVPISILSGANASSISTDYYGNVSVHANPVGVILSLVGFAYLIYNTVYLGGTTGVTFGRRVAKTKLVRRSTGLPIGAGLAFLRHLAHLVDTLICLIGWLFPLWDVKRQTLADKIVDTVVVNTD
jgi:uncharacterized RDD family membrane protein YckC